MMKKWPGRLLPAIALLAGMAASVEGQSLADVARREAERRKAIKAPSRVYTNADLKPSPVDSVPATIAPPPSQPAGSTAVDSHQAADAATPSADSDGKSTRLPTPRDKRDEEHWRERAKLIRDRLDRLRSDTAAIEGRVVEGRTELKSAPAERAAVLANEIQQASRDLARFQVELRLIEQEWTTFEERARQAKIPSDWIR